MLTTERGAAGEHRELAEFLRQEAEAIGRAAARQATATLPVGGTGARRRLAAVFGDHLRDLSRLLDSYGEEGVRLYGEHLRGHASVRRSQGLAIHEAIEEEAFLLEAALEVWGRRRGPAPLAVTRLLSLAFAESAGQVADVWLTYQRSESVRFQEAALLETIVHHLEEAILVIEADGRLSYATPSLLRVLGVHPRQFVGITDDKLHELLLELEVRTREGQPLRLEDLPHRVALRLRRPVLEEQLHLRRPNGDRAVLEVYAAPVFDEEQELRGAVVTLRDQTERFRYVQELERALAEVREMQARLLSRSRLEALGELAGSAAHAMNNLLNVLTLRLPRLHELPGGTEEAAVLERSVREMAGVVGRLQEFAAVRPPRVARTTDLNHVVEEALALTRAQFAPGTGTAIEARLGDVPPVWAERELLAELLTALLLGVRDAAPTGSTLRLQTEPEGRHALVRVSAAPVEQLDSLERLFEPLAAGGGLSLGMSRQAARSWGGDLAARAGEDRALVFELRLRAAPAEQPAAEQRPERPAPAKRASRVLVVDDDADNAAVCAELLRDTGVEVATAGSAEEAVRVAAELRPDGALVDLLLPDRDGWSVARELQARYPGVRIAVVSGLAAEASPEAAEVEAVFRKPLDPATLLNFLGLEMP